eukprot:TRINITY_DN3096_c0_g1_i1.p1 TRINITY_DN3096_c0_g1~~TRINITY_DN3096_c0_g1_i1.p1  ORF type:complete len:875 (+),score=259.48 TRINITY_DN3096_c0_g1_i1:582-3206(+)
MEEPNLLDEDPRASPVERRRKSIDLANMRKLKLLINIKGDSIAAEECLFSSNPILLRVFAKFFPHRVPIDVQMCKDLGGTETDYNQFIQIFKHSGVLMEGDSLEDQTLMGMEDSFSLKLFLKIHSQENPFDFSHADEVVDLLIKCDAEEWIDLIHLPLFPAIPHQSEGVNQWKTQFAPPFNYLSLHEIAHSSEVSQIWTVKSCLYREKEFPHLNRSQMYHPKTCDILQHLQRIVTEIPSAMKYKDSFVEKEIVKIVEKEISALLDRLDVSWTLKTIPFVHSSSGWNRAECVNLLGSNYDDMADIDKNVIVSLPRYLHTHVELLKRLGAKERWDNPEPKKIPYCNNPIESRFERFLYSKEFSDIEFEFVGHPPIYAHRLIMSANSPKFESQFLNGKLRESQLLVGEHFKIVMNKDPNVVRIVLCYVYTGFWKEDDELWAETLELADEWCLEPLKKVLENFMLSSFGKFTKENVLDLLEYSKLYHLDRLESYCRINALSNRILLLASKKMRKNRRKLYVDLFGEDELNSIDEKEKMEKHVVYHQENIRLFILRNSMTLPIITIVTKTTCNLGDLKAEISKLAQQESSAKKYFRFRRVALRQNHTNRFASDVYNTSMDSDLVSSYNFENQPFIYLEEQEETSYFEPVVSPTFMITFKLFDDSKGIPVSLCDLVLPVEMTVKNLKKYIVEKILKGRGIHVEPEEILLIDEETQDILNRLVRLDSTLERHNLRTGDIVHIEILKDENKEGGLVENYFKNLSKTTILYIEEKEESYQRRRQQNEITNGKEENEEHQQNRSSCRRIQIKGENVLNTTFTMSGLQNLIKNRFNLEAKEERIKFSFQEKVYSGKWIAMNENNLSFLMFYKFPNLIEFRVEIAE